MFKKIAFVPAILAVSSMAHAALPTGVDTAITAASTDGVELVGLMAVGGAAVYLIARVLGRFGLKL